MTSERARKLSRRGFLGALGMSLSAVPLGCRRRTAAPPVRAPAPSRGDQTRVVIIRHQEATNADLGINEGAVRSMVDAALRAVTGATAAADAWRQFVSPRDTVALKVNCLAGPPLSSHPEVAQAIITGLLSVGVDKSQVIVYDRDSPELVRAGYEVRTRGGPLCFGTDRVGYDAEPTIVRSTGTCYSRIVSEMATAIINVPILKDHDLCGLSASLKNHFGSILNPNKMHMNRCCPAVADVNCASHIRPKQKLIICDALLVCYYGGPGYKPETTVRYNRLLVGTDPVAVDRVGLDVIDKLRAENGRPSLKEDGLWPTYLDVAADPEYGLGTSDLASIEVVEVDAGMG